MDGSNCSVKKITLHERMDGSRWSSKRTVPRKENSGYKSSEKAEKVAVPKFTLARENVYNYYTEKVLYLTNNCNWEGAQLSS